MEFPMKYLLDLTSSLLTKGRRFLPSQLSRNLGGFLLLIPQLRGSLGRRCGRVPLLGLLHKPDVLMQELGFSFPRKCHSTRRASLAALPHPPP